MFLSSITYKFCEELKYSKLGRTPNCLTPLQQRLHHRHKDRSNRYALTYELVSTYEELTWERQLTPLTYFRDFHTPGYLESWALKF
jgi:hypothetical protein